MFILACPWDPFVPIISSSSYRMETSLLRKTLLEAGYNMKKDGVLRGMKVSHSYNQLKSSFGAEILINVGRCHVN